MNVPANIRTSDGGMGVIVYCCRSNASIVIYRLTVCPYFMILHLISYFNESTVNIWAEMVIFCIKHIGNRKIFLKQYPIRVPTNPFADKWVLKFYIIYVNS